jgi:hypothetical protein
MFCTSISAGLRTFFGVGILGAEGAALRGLPRSPQQLSHQTVPLNFDITETVAGRPLYF